MLGGGSAWFFGGPGAILVAFLGPAGVIFLIFLYKKPMVVWIAFRVCFFVGFGGALGAKIGGIWSNKPVRK